MRPQLPQLFAGLGDASTGVTHWEQVQLDPTATSVTFQPNNSYAVLASVTTGASLQQIQSYVQGKSFTVASICEPPGSCSSVSSLTTNDTSDLQSYLSTLSVAPRAGERWVFAQGTYTSAQPWTVDKTDSGLRAIVASYSISAQYVLVQGDGTSAFASGSGSITTPAGAGSSGVSTPLIVLGVASILGVGAWWWHKHTTRRGRRV